MLDIDLYLGLVHYPIKNKHGQVVTTSVTNMDLHDISRSCKTFGVKKYYVVTPVLAQREILKKIMGHWDLDDSNEYNPDRFLALKLIDMINTIEDAKKDIVAMTNKEPLVVVTGANFKSDHGNETKLKEMAKTYDRPVLLLFGTGHGLVDAVVDKADYMLGPIFGEPSVNYNHLSVRSAVAIYLDRLVNG